MKRILAGCALLLVLAATPALAQIHFGVSIGRAPRAHFYFGHQPRFTYVPDQRVYVVNDPDVPYDMFRYGGSYYVYNNDNGWWYRANTYRGPWVGVRAQLVPRGIFDLDRDHYQWRHRPEGDYGRMRGERGMRGYERGRRGDRDDRGDRDYR